MSSSRAAPQAFFLPDAVGGQRLAIHHPPQGPVQRGRIVYIHPFAEEMNKARRMAALQSRMLAAAGYAVLQLDLAGCGDSSGDFGEASWQAWVGDVLRGCAWLREQQHGSEGPLWLWGLRAGCLLAVEAGRQLDEPAHYCFWQPATSGKLLLQQFLRIRVAAEMVGGAGKGLMDEMKKELAAGRSVEVAGYTLSPALTAGLEQALLKPAERSCRVEWFELTTREDGELTPASTQALAQWTAAGHACRSHLVNGPAFWQTTEIEDAPALLDSTLAALVA